jgi:hypothetical protein
LAGQGVIVTWQSGRWVISGEASVVEAAMQTLLDRQRGRKTPAKKTLSFQKLS